MRVKLVYFFWVAFTCLVLSAKAQQNKLPNVVIILADDMGYGDVSCLNPAARTQTPSIDEMAKAAAVFTDAHTGGAVCIPSRYGILTGRHYFRLPRHNECLGYLPPLIEKGRETIGSLLQKAGYVTACTGKWHLGLNWGVRDTTQPQIPAIQYITNTDFGKLVDNGPASLGFNYTYILPASLDMPPYVFVNGNKVVDSNIVLTANVYPKSKDGTIKVWDGKYVGADDIYWERGVWWRNGEMSKSFRIENCLDTIAAKGMQFITRQAQKKTGKPFMLYLALSAPHTPWVPANQFKGKTAMGTYSDFILHTDNIVGQVNQTLKNLHLDENTIVIFTSDNGAHWSEEDIQAYGHQSNYGARGQKGDIYNGGHHVPLIIKWPAAINKSFIYPQAVSLIDFMATFAEMTGQPVTKPYAEDSFSFFKVISRQGTTAARNYIIYEAWNGMLAIKKDNWKYIDGLGSGGFTAPVKVKPVAGGPAGQLYNLQTDPLESNNLYTQYPDKVKELSALLNKVKKQGYSHQAF